MKKTPALLLLIAVLFIVSVLLNFVWEVAQMPLYVDGGNWLAYAGHCVVPSLGDGIIVLLIFGTGWVVMHRIDWFVQPGWSAYVVMLGTGLVIAVVVEWVAVYGLERWRYTARMPMVPLLGVGLSPVLQMLLLPPLIFGAVAWWLGRMQARHPSSGAWSFFWRE